LYQHAENKNTPINQTTNEDASIAIIQPKISNQSEP